MRARPQRPLPLRGRRLAEARRALVLGARHLAPCRASTENTFKQTPPPAGTGKTLFVLGADSSLGRDELQRLLYGGRVSLTVAIGATLLALLIGVTLGTVAAFFGGWVDSVVSRFTDLVMAFPVLLLAIVLGSTFSKKLDDVTLGGALNQGVLSLILLIGLFTWFYPARIVRSLILSLRAREFVEAAEMVGSSDGKIMRDAPLPTRDPGTHRVGDARSGDEHHARGGDHLPRGRDQAADVELGNDARGHMGTVLSPIRTTRWRSRPG